MRYYFSKVFEVHGLGKVDYWQCSECGFCASKTHFEMTNDAWEILNKAFHDETHYASDNPYNRNQRYFNQAQMLYLMRRAGMVAPDAWLDWGGGVGAVSRLLDDQYGVRLDTYDRYFTPLSHPIDAARLRARGFDLVLNTAVFEHVRDRKTLDEIESYVKATGCFAIHTLVPETVPKDPQWMYLLPVHCAFHTNRSMQVLMDAWGYTCSVYNEHSKLWVLFRAEPEQVRAKSAHMNRQLGWNYLHFKSGFVDYWK
jgi:hypothetical protein